MNLKFPDGTDVPVFVAHVRKGYEDRKIHIENHLRDHGIVFSWMLDGDVSDITPSILEQYFEGKMMVANGITSCALKHFRIYEHMVEKNFRGALILEDDIFLRADFIKVFNQTMHEAEQHHEANPLLISYENSNLKFIPNEEQVSGKHLYRREKGRCTGAYFINRIGAEKIIHHALTKKCGVPIDYLHNQLSQSGELQIYWCHPTVAEQGSHNGLFASGIAGRKKGLIRRIKWAVQKFYKANIWTPKK